MRDGQRSADLLVWYDAHARVLPWRLPPGAGHLPDPYAVWLSEIMLQQTTVAAVRDYFTRFMTLWPTVTTLAQADDERVMGEWAGLGYYARARNLLKCARVVTDEHAGVFPDSAPDLVKLPGIGPYTAAAIAAIAFDRAEPVMDGNVERVMARLFRVETPLPQAKPALRIHAGQLTPRQRPGDYAQAVMDLGATICTPKNPTCGICPWNRDCLAHKAGIQATLPVRPAKAVKPVRYGIAYLAQRKDGAWLLERRPQTGLLGGMLGWPGAAWGDEPVEDPPIAANWQDLGVEVRHTFTHFHLRLSLRLAELPLNAKPVRGAFVTQEAFRASDLPSVMRKAFDLARNARD